MYDGYVVTYESDFHAWTFEQARRLRAGEAVDVKNVAEELETLGRSEQEQLTNRLAVLLQHLLNSEFQPEKKTPGLGRHNPGAAAAGKQVAGRKPQPEAQAA